MENKNRKYIPWDKKDYLKSLITFLGHTLIIVCLFLGFAFIGEDVSWPKFKDFLYADGYPYKHIFPVLSLLIVNAIVYLYFYFENKDFLREIKNVNSLFVCLELTLVLYKLVEEYVGIYARPFAFCPLTIYFLTNKRTAVFMTFISAMMLFMSDIFCTSVLPSGTTEFTCLLLSFTSGFFAIFLANKTNSRIEVLYKGLLTALPVLIIIDFSNIVATLNNPLENLVYALISGVSSTVFTIVFLPLFEYVFSAITEFRLGELTSHKAKLIQELIQKAPGTFNHSLVVATLAESCATAIGEDPLLARACAYYHDIGKADSPQMFTENQDGYNPHDDLTPELSADIIRSHALDGYNKIIRNRLPKILADVAIEHHGTMPIRYFLAKAQKYSEEKLDATEFSYRGPKPQTKIASIIMIADGCEAKVRTISDRTHEKVDACVKEIIEERLDNGQFDECDITMKDLDIIRNTITNGLAGVYHERVQYPKLKRKN